MMGLMDGIRKAVVRLRGGGEEPSRPAYQRTTTASRRAEARGSMLHVSKPITDEVRMAVDWDMPSLAASLLSRQKGTTYHSPRSHVKRAADELANDMMLNNKQRRYLRSRMVRRLEEMNAE